MAGVLLRALSFVLLILFGYTLKKAGVFGPKDYQVLVKLVMNLTLPAAAITNFSGLRLSASLAVVTLLGLGTNLALVLLGWLWSRKKGRGEQAFCMLNFSGYNIGAFATPYLQSFLGAPGVSIACLFDAGNAVMCTGASYALTSWALSGEGGKRFGVGSALKKLFSSVPFDVYLGLILLALAGIPVPQTVLTLLAPASAANAGLAMLMVGLMFEWDARPEYLRSALCAIVVRNLLAAGVALALNLFVPLPREVLQVVTVVLFAPISVASPAFTASCGGDPGLAGFTNSLSILVSLVLMTSLLLGMGIA